MSISAQSTVGAVAREYPLATRVFARHGIDYCCGGGQEISVACGAKGVDVDSVLADLEREITGNATEEIRWIEKPIGDLIDHILEAYHEPLKVELPRIEEMMHKVHSVHGDKDQARFDELLRTVIAIKLDIEQHLPKEEEVLFPMIKSGQGAMADGPIHVMEMEHETLGELLRRARSLTDDYVAPDEACNTWRALWAALENLEIETHKHIHLENNILHVRARQG